MAIPATSKCSWCPAAVAFVLLVIAAVPARAGHYDLSSIDIVDEATMAAFVPLKIATTQDLWEATRTPGKVATLARKVKLTPAALRDLHELCDLLWVDGIGPKVARVLTAAGVRNLAALARQEQVALADLIRDTNKKLEILGKLPDPDTTRSWIEQAKARAKTGARPGAPNRR
jgi:predicted flap endonuclease-1-like 5' DNA nuclease